MRARGDDKIGAEMLKAATVIPLFITSCLCQFVMDLGMKPDVTFGEQNERFDVASIIQDQSRMDIANPTIDNRRHGNSKDNVQNERGNENNEKHNEENEKEDDHGRDIENSEIKEENNEPGNKESGKELDKGTELLDALKDAVGSIDMRNFAYHSNMESSPDDNDYEKNLSMFGKRRNLQEMMNYLKDHKNGRRAPPDPENEILFNYGVPINMKVEGILQVPLEKK